MNAQRPLALLLSVLRGVVTKDFRIQRVLLQDFEPPSLA